MGADPFSDAFGQGRGGGVERPPAIDPQLVALCRAFLAGEGHYELHPHYHCHDRKPGGDVDLLANGNTVAHLAGETGTVYHTVPDAALRCALIYAAAQMEVKLIACDILSFRAVLSRHLSANGAPQPKLKSGWADTVPPRVRALARTTGSEYEIEFDAADVLERMEDSEAQLLLDNATKPTDLGTRGHFPPSALSFALAAADLGHAELEDACQLVLGSGEELEVQLDESELDAWVKANRPRLSV